MIRATRTVTSAHLAILLLVGLLARATNAQADTPTHPLQATALAQQILGATGVQGGLVVHLGCGDGSLTAALRAGDHYLVQGLSLDADGVLEARQNIRSRDLYGPVSVEHFDGEHLPYIDNLVNLVVAEQLGDVTRGELLRVLAPGGVAYIGEVRRTKDEGRNEEADRLAGEVMWTKIVKPRPEDIDEWTHWLHGPDGNAVANDLVVGPPRRVQWMAPPRWQRHHEATPSVSAVVSSGGRLFAIINEAPAGIDGMPDRWVLVARDAFNGKLLWKRPIDQWGWSQWSDHSYGHGRWNHPTHIARRLVAVDDRVYVTLGFNAPLSALDAATGQTFKTYDGTQFTDEILYEDGMLVLSVNAAAQGPGRVQATPPVNKEIVVLDATTGDVRWRTGDFVGIASKADAVERVTHLEMVLGDGKVYCIEDEAVIALDMRTGERMWRVDRLPRPAKRPVTYGSYYFTNLCSMVYHDQVLLFMEPDPKLAKQPWNGPAQSTLLGIASDTGEVLWQRECGMWGHYNQGDIFFIDNLAWVHDGQSFAMLGLDPRTGEVKQTLSTQEALDQGHHHRCYRNKATPRYIVTGRRGVEFIDIHTQENLRHHWTRGTCRYGVLPCNGLLYVPPHPCICYITAKLNGFFVLAPKRSTKYEGRRTKEEALQRGPAYGESRADRRESRARAEPDWRLAHRLTLTEDSDVGPSNRDSGLPGHLDSGLSTPDSGLSWPTYRHDAARSGCAGTELSSELKVAWDVQLGGRLSSPVVAGGRVFLASSDTHTVHAFGAENGKPLWSYTAGGRVDTPPTVHGDLALFGAADGWVYCLRAADGQLVWRRRAAPDELRMVNDDQLESPWPVHGSVLVQGDVAYFAAGRSSFLDGGIYVYAVRPETGRLIRQQRLNSLDPETDDMAECRLPYDMPPDALGALPDILVGDGENVYMRHLEFDSADLAYGSAADADAAKRRSAYPAVGGHLMSVAGMLDDNWFNQTYWTVDGQAHSKLLVFDADGAYGVKPFPGNARHSRAIFTPGSKGYTLFANNRPKHQQRWSSQVPVRIRAMLVADSILFIAGTPDVVDAADPWSALDGGKGGVLWAVSTADGARLAEYTLDHPPIFDGLAAADRRLFVSTTAGTLVCFDGQ
jgi:outer membrane protein assembly factor BamB